MKLWVRFLEESPALEEYSVQLRSRTLVLPDIPSLRLCHVPPGVMLLVALYAVEATSE